jgi:hypothetical protein
MPNRFARPLSVLMLGLLVLSGRAFAHHGDSGRYEDNLTTITGVLDQVQLVNPHSVLILAVKGSDGTVVRWRGELGSAIGMRRWGWTREYLKVGETLTMTGRRLKNGSPFMTLSEGARVVDAEGHVLYRGNNPGEPEQPPVVGR